MPERIVKVRLSAHVQEFEAGMFRAAAATRTVGTETQRLAQQKQAFEQLGRTAMTAGGLMAAGIGVAVKRFADFDEAMSHVAATGADARKNIDELRQAAIDAGARTVFSAKESANAIEEMSKAGVDAKDVLGGGLAGALDLAAAGGLGVADAAGIAAVALKTFKLEGSDMGHVADLLAAGAGKAMGDVQDLSLALRQGGQAASLTGLSIEETTAALSAFASQGLLGSDAGTSLKTMLLNLNPTTKKARELVDELNIAAFDQQGNFIGLAEYAGKLQAALGGMSAEQQSAALKTIFGTDAYRAAAVVLDEGEAGIRRWISAVDDQGYAADTARTRLDNLKGDVEALGGAVDSAFITMGEAANGPLRGFVQGLTALVDGFNQLPDPAKDAVFWIGAGASAALTAGGIYLAAVPKIAEYKANLNALGLTASKTTRIVGAAAGGLSAALLGASVVMGAFASAQAQAKERSEELAETLDQVTGAATNATRGAVADLLTRKGEGLFGIPTESIQDWGKQLGVSLELATDAVLDNGDAFEQLSVYYRAAEGDAAALQIVMDRTGLTADMARDRAEQFTRGLDKLRAGASDAKDEIERQNKAQEVAGDTAITVADAYREEADAASSLEGELAGLLDTMNKANAINADAVESNARWRQALSGIKDEVEEQKEAYKKANGSLDGFKLSLDESTVAGSANAAMLADVAGAAQKAAEDQYSVDLATMSAEDAAKRYVDTLAGQRAEFEKNAIKAGFAKDAVQDLADRVFGLPDKKTIEILANPDKALSAIERFIRDASAKTVRIGVVTYRKDGKYGITGQVGNGEDLIYAGGGAVRGPGSGTSDSIPAWLSNGEHVLTASDVAAMGGQANVYAFREALHGGSLTLASGGAVTLQRARDAVSRAEAKLRAAKSKKGRESAKDELADAKADLADVQRSFRSELTDWYTGNRRGLNRAAGMEGNGLTLVDRLLDIASDTGGKRGAKLRVQALDQEKAYLRLEKAADTAAEKVKASTSALESLRDKSASVAASVSNVVRGLFDLATLGAVKTEQVEKTRKVQRSMTVGGQTMTWFDTEKYTEQVTTKPTFKSIFAGTKTAETGAKRFADKLKQLADRKVNGAFLQEIAMMGVENGEPIADAFLAATASEISAFNTSYKNLGTYSDVAGKTVADANYKKLIETAEKQLANDNENAAAIRAELKSQTDRLLKSITDALRAGVRKSGGGPVHGPGTSTSDSIAAWLSDEEHVWTAAEVRAWGGHDNVAALRAGRLVPTAARYSSTVPSGAAATSGERVVVDQRGSQFYAYDPTEGARKNKEHLTRVLDAHGL